MESWVGTYLDLEGGGVDGVGHGGHPGLIRQAAPGEAAGGLCVRVPRHPVHLYTAVRPPPL